jgi:hypothetical protein
MSSHQIQVGNCEQNLTSKTPLGSAPGGSGFCWPHDYHPKRWRLDKG